MIHVSISYVKRLNNTIKISGNGILIPALSMTRGISRRLPMKGSENGEKGEKKRREKDEKKNGGTCRDCLDMHAALAVGLKIRQLSGEILASS